MTTAIHRDEPPYLQIARYYRERIERAELLPGHTLPSVRQMAEQWKVAHTTAARALKALQAEGLAASVPGSGTVVISRPAGSPTAEQLARNLRSSGQLYPPGYHSTILSAELIPAPAHVADVLGLDVDQPVIRRQRVVRDASGSPAEYSTCYIRGEFADSAPALLTTEPIPQGVLGYLEARTDKTATTGCDQYSAQPASDESAAALNLPAGTPVLIERHWWAADDGTILQYSESTEPGARWRTHHYNISDPA